MNPDDVQLTKTEEVERLSDYATKKKENMEKLLNECPDMSAFWDSKVPEKDIKFYRFFSFQQSDKKAVLEKINSYKKIYQDLSAAVLPITDSNPMNCKELRRKLTQLKERLSEVYESAKREKQTTSSSAIYDMHYSFIQEYEKLNWYLIDVDNAALNKMLEEAQNGWRDSLRKIDVLTQQVTDISQNYTDINHKYADICEKYETLKTENEKAAKKQEELLAQNKTLETKIDVIVEILERLTPRT